MPSTSQAQARFFRFVEHDPERAKREGVYPKGMDRSQLHDYASTKDAGLPKRAHLEDGSGPRYFRWMGHEPAGSARTMFPSGYITGDATHHFAVSTDAPQHMEDGGTGWIGAATSAPGFRKGALTAKAHAAGESPMTFARSHTGTPGRTGAQARFAVNAQKRR